MNEWQVVLMRVREFFRKDPQTNWGKNQIIKCLDEMEEKILAEEAKE